MNRIMDVDEFVADTPVDLVRGRRGAAGPTWTDLRVLLTLLKAHRPVRCLEVGIHRGHTARLLLDHAPSIEHYVGIDRTPERAKIIAGELVCDDPRVELLITETGTRSMHSADIPHAPFDWIFIDSNHSYGGVKFDTEFVQPLLAPGAILVWHDYGVPSQFSPGTKPFGVTPYLDEWEGEPPITTFMDPPHSSSIAFQRFGGEGAAT